MKRKAINISLLVTTLSFTALIFLAGSSPFNSLSERARRLHASALVIDGHNDLPWRLREENDLTVEKHDLSSHQAKFHTDIPRLRRGGVGAQFWSAYVPSDTMETGTSVAVTKEQMGVVHAMIRQYPDTFELALSAADIERIRAKGKIASLIGLEGGHSINNSLETLRDLFQRGARYMTLAHRKNLSWVESATDSAMEAGLTPFGEEVVREMNRLGMFIDISHISAKAMRHVLKVTTRPVIASHSSAHALKNHVRNVPDDVLRMVAQNGGVIMVNFYPVFLSPEDSWVPLPSLNLSEHTHDCVEEDISRFRKEGRAPKATLSTLVDHIDHIVKVAGIEHVGLGSDFDGVPYLPVGLEDVSTYPAITEELLRRGYSEDGVRKVLGENLMRAFRAMQPVSGG